ncbi:MAG: hypothetical protein DBX00_11475 [Verrucomicrobia bacterium]|jgi:hypothetical protein|nr:hypothetical protein [Roseibacillus sp.]RCL33608.1 MAG: hypothetical protein DBX00_11475 [Verrucomicrobiota bacterium]RPF91026.1 MAG: hypothetical protein CBB78_004370 [Roseibacillus sp. TMED18]|tara:strand:- start:444 stop:773 length:330 start_codon:yes stop_codon:yes gene_type:complete
MGFFRNKPKVEGSFSAREEKLLARISELEEFIEQAPERIRIKMEKEISTMPPPDDLDDRRREHKFYSRLSRGEIRNEHRYQTRSAFVFLLLVMGILALTVWIYTVLQAV